AWFASLPGTHRREALIGYVAGAAFLLPALALLLESAFVLRSTELGARCVFLLACDLFAQLQRRSLRFHGTRTVSDSMMRVVSDSGCVAKMTDALILTPGPAILAI